MSFSCTDHFIHVTNPWDLLNHAIIPAVVCAGASRMVGNNPQAPNIPARRIKPLTAAIYGGTHNLLARLGFDVICRISNTVTRKQVIAVAEVVGGGTIVLSCLGGVIGAIAATHILSRDTAKSVTGESIDFFEGGILNFVVNTIKML